ncbi:DUF6671 family protein [Flavobacterium cyclinae]|uniref:DUF6671 family protein n=1 Tax=Flavobacterium cyclinae TaxID=2895947 RepID=UPI001E4B7BB8|nr:DUF6671 family protein [Flavobacterium cyclinae]UGS19952.1 hypothetical protein LOS86_07935 [Flavobacterium cyclinae]
MKININFFKDRDLLIVTKHKKEQVIAPLLQNELGVNCILSQQFDTDSLGTFSGEVERKQDAFTTLRQKCLQAMELEGYDLAIATEGSFGNHPSVFFAAANEELILLVDKRNNLEIFERLISLETNFNSEKITSKSAFNSFLERVKFPSHAIIIKDEEKDWNSINKGVNDKDTADRIFEELYFSNGYCFVETDMRAMYNPTRMAIIEAACKKLLLKIHSICPNCQSPGFGIVKVESGLACSSCSMPTKSILAHVYQCQKCHFEEKKMHPNHKLKEDPMYCDFCNP